jgi:hypothetical protein
MSRRSTGNGHTPESFPDGSNDTDSFRRLPTAPVTTMCFPPVA